MTPDLIAVHRLLVSSIVYPATEAEARRDGLRWDPALVGRRWPDTPDGSVGFFREAMGWSRPAYHAVVWPDGTRWQWAPLSTTVWHAGPRWNPRSLALATVGDWRRESPPEPLYRAAVEVAAEWAVSCDLWPTRRHARAGTTVYEVSGHGELARAEGRVWDCPGDGWPLEPWRGDVAADVERLRAESGALSGGWRERAARFGWR